MEPAIILILMPHNKFDALREYVVDHPEIHWGFVREVNDILRFNNTVYQEDPTGDQWVLFKDVFFKISST
jgi:hypothetical protein